MKLSDTYEELVGGNVEIPGEENISLKKYTEMKKALLNLKGLWGKGCFLAMLGRSKKEYIKPIQAKLLRELRSYDKAVFVRHIEPHYKSIMLKAFTDPNNKKLIEGILEAYANFGEDDFIILAKAYATFNKENLYELMARVSISDKKLGKIENGF